MVLAFARIGNVDARENQRTGRPRYLCGLEILHSQKQFRGEPVARASRPPVRYYRRDLMRERSERNLETLVVLAFARIGNVDAIENQCRGEAVARASRPPVRYYRRELMRERSERNQETLVVLAFARIGNVDAIENQRTGRPRYLCGLEILHSQKQFPGEPVARASRPPVRYFCREFMRERSERNQEILVLSLIHI